MDKVWCGEQTDKVSTLEVNYLLECYNVHKILCGDSVISCYQLKPCVYATVSTMLASFCVLSQYPSSPSASSPHFSAGWYHPFSSYSLLVVVCVTVWMKKHKNRKHAPPPMCLTAFSNCRCPSGYTGSWKLMKG